MIDGKIRVINLFSGSKRNCTLVDTGETKILIDCGGTAKAICTALEQVGYRPDEICAVFITHEHSDHICALPALAKKYGFTVHITDASAGKFTSGTYPGLSERMERHENEFTVSFPDGTEVEAFSVTHDSICCVGYKISKNGHSVGITTDIGYVTQRVYDELFGCEKVIMEANHDREMLKNGPYPAPLKSRILSDSGHLSNDDCAEICAALARSGTKSFMLAHLSEENNTPQIAFDAVNAAVAGYGVTVCVASQNGITEI